MVVAPRGTTLLKCVTLIEARGLLRAFRRQGIEPSMMALNLLMNQPEWTASVFPMIASSRRVT